tara:strand:- start:628 stop:2367 length:1740 start_codon:yes stop_codon:yes gene_type:complete
LIEIINKEIKSFLSSLTSIDKEILENISQKSQISITDNLSKGHLTTNICMVAGSILKTNSNELALKLKDQLENIKLFEKIKVAGPGFINITLFRKDFVSIIDKINIEKEDYGKSSLNKGKKMQIEFVSANPTGPLHVGHGRGAAYGDAVGRILKATGSIVEREYYINDAGRQIDILTASVILKLISKNIDNYFPTNAYKGDYIEKICKKFNKKIIFNFDNKSIQKKNYKDPEKEIDQVIIILKDSNKENWNLIKEFSLNEMILSIKSDLKKFNVSFDRWFKETSLGSLDEKSSQISNSINILTENGSTYEKDGAIWLNTEISNDDKHRVLIRDNGKATYFASDVAYHKNKVDRGFDKLINVWGADHHGYIKRIEASIENLGFNKDKLIVKLVQFANLFKNGEKVKMSTRSGDFYKLRDLIEEIGSDAARFFYLSKQADQHLDFDIDLAKSNSKENIFYYIQYAHARIVSLEEKVYKKYPSFEENLKPMEKNLYDNYDGIIHEVSKYPNIVDKSANSLQPHLIIYYLKDLSHLFHSFYNDNHVLSESDENIQSIIQCMSAVKQVISNGLNLLGISPLKKM